MKHKYPWRTLLAVLTLTGAATAWQQSSAHPTTGPITTSEAKQLLDTLPIKNPVPLAGYSRAQFGEKWTDNNTALWGKNGLSTQWDILSDQLTDITCKSPPTRKSAPHCSLKSGTLHDPYTGKTFYYERSTNTNKGVVIDHLVPLATAWQTGAQNLTPQERRNLANDPLELIATNGHSNSSKGDKDPSQWLPPDTTFHCQYATQYIRVKHRYRLWVTRQEHKSLRAILTHCPSETLTH